MVGSLRMRLEFCTFLADLAHEKSQALCLVAVDTDCNTQHYRLHFSFIPFARPAPTPHHIPLATKHIGELYQCSHFNLLAKLYKCYVSSLLDYLRIPLHLILPPPPPQITPYHYTVGGCGLLWLVMERCEYRPE
jgi:hypothetical protein